MYICLYINAHCQLAICVLRQSPGININFCCHKSNETYSFTKFLASSISMCICIHITYIWTNDCIHAHTHTCTHPLPWRPIDSSVCDFYCLLLLAFFFIIIINVEIWVAWGRKSPGQPAAQYSPVCMCMRNYKGVCKNLHKNVKILHMSLHRNCEKCVDMASKLLSKQTNIHAYVHTDMKVGISRQVV